RFENELFSNIDAIDSGTQKQADKARLAVRDNLAQIALVFVKQKYMRGDEFSMRDVAIAPLLWRLDFYGIQLPKQAAPLMKYAERLFSRPAFSEALTSAERGMRNARRPAASFAPRRCRRDRPRRASHVVDRAGRDPAAV